MSVLVLLLLTIVLCTGGIFTAEAKVKWKKISKKAIAHTWYTASWFKNNDTNGDYWASAYKTQFKKDGTVCQKGYRNKDLGTYKISKDRKKVVATYNKCYYDYPGYGFRRVKGYKYTVTYRMKDNNTLHAKYSKESSGNTNACTGYIYRHK